MKRGDIFNKVVVSTPKRNSFDLTHERKFSCEIGKVYPCLVEEAYPSDSWSLRGSTLNRTAPMVTPMMHTVSIYQHYFFVPNRILWSNWDLFITGGDKFNSEAPVPEPPYVVIPNDGFQVGSVADYLGFPTDQGETMKVSAFPFAAYYRTWQEYYADENLMDTQLYMLQDGDNSDFFLGQLGYGLRGSAETRCWEKDYFTAALPEPQKGPEVTIPLGDTAPIVYNGDTGFGRTFTRKAQGGEPFGEYGIPVTGEDDQGLLMIPSSSGQVPVDIDVSTTHHVDLSAATSATVNSWRLAMAVQRLYERLARGGSRTIEFLRSVWGSRASSSRLDRPEYFGGAKEYLSVSEVLQTSATDDSDTPQGNMAGHGVSVTRVRDAHYNVSEYGIILGMYSILPKTAYSQGVRKSWLRLTDRFDYYFPDLAHIGEQPVLNAELYVSGNDAIDKGTFGYQPYGTELRYIPDTFHGEFRSTQTFWHMGRLFDNLPQLNSEFVSAKNATRRVFVDLTGDTDLVYVNMRTVIKAKRCIPRFGTPM